jgi:hypothetical protein
MSKNRLLSGRVKKVTGTRLDGTRYEYISLAQAEPDLGLPSSTGSVLISNLEGGRSWSSNLKIVNSVVRINSGIPAVNTGTGALVVTGGVGVSGDIFAGSIYSNGVLVTAGQNTFTNALYITAPINSTSTTTGGLVITGGVGIGQDLWVGGEIHAQKLVIEYTTITTTIVETDDIIVTSNPTDSTEPGIGALVVSAGGASIARNLNVGSIIINDGTNATDANSGALIVTGGAGIGDDLWVGGKLYVGGGLAITTSSISGSAVTTIVAGTDTAVSSATGVVTVWNTSNLQSVTDRGNSTTNIIHVLNTSDVFVSTSSHNASIIAEGGLYVGKSLYVEDIVYSRGLQVITTASLGGLGVGIINAGTDTAIDYHTGIVTIWNTSTLDSVLSRGHITTSSISILNSTSSTSSDSGALTVFGGVGIGENLHVRGTVTAEGGFVGLNPTSIYENSSNVTVIDTGTDARIVVVVNSQTSAVFTENQVTFNKPVEITDNTQSISTDTGALVVRGGVGIGRDVNLGGKISFADGGVIDERAGHLSLKSGSTSTLIYTDIPLVVKVWGFGTDFGFGDIKITDDDAGNLYLIFIPGPIPGITDLLRVGDHITVDYGTARNTTIAGELGTMPNNPYIGSYPDSVAYRLTDNFGITGQPDYNVGALSVSEYTAWEFNADGSLAMPGGLTFDGGRVLYNSNGSGVNIWDGPYTGPYNGELLLDNTGVTLFSNNETHSWNFNNDGNLLIPGGGALWTLGQGTAGLTANILDPYNVNIGLDYNSKSLTITADNLVTIQTSSGTSYLNFSNDGTLTNSGKVVIQSTETSTVTNTSNALYVQGGAWIDLDLNVRGAFSAVTATIVQVTGNSGQFFGDANGFGALYAGIPVGFTELPSTVLQLTADNNDYVQSNFQNINNGPKASTDWVLTSADGANFENFIDMAITSGSWDGSQDGSIGTAVGPNDGYLYVQGNTSTVGQGNLVLGASSFGSVVKVFAGGVGSESIVAVFNSGTTTTTSSDSGAFVVKGGVGVGENLYVKGTVTAEGGFVGLNATRIYENTSSVAVIDTGSISKVVVTIANTTNTTFSRGLVDIAADLDVQSVRWKNSTTNIVSVYQVYNHVTQSLDTIFV